MRWTALFLLALVALCGCGSSEPDATVPTDAPKTQAATDPSQPGRAQQEAMPGSVTNN
ncbi:MAG: hypothetical protein J0H02_18090 [Armatimonadetes bacterium]|nr:hypothetical protein [Armatimonadota bacterium]